MRYPPICVSSSLVRRCSASSSRIRLRTPKIANGTRIHTMLMTVAKKNSI